jgi:hypothetical protein
MMTYELDDIEKAALLNKVVDRARADLNDGRPLTEMRRSMSEEQAELQRDALSLAYTAIRFSGLWKELSGAEWDTLAERLGKHLVAMLNVAIDDEFTRREAEKG